MLFFCTACYLVPGIKQQEAHCWTSNEVVVVYPWYILLHTAPPIPLSAVVPHVCGSRLPTCISRLSTTGMGHQPAAAPLELLLFGIHSRSTVVSAIHNQHGPGAVGVAGTVLYEYTCSSIRCPPNAVCYVAVWSLVTGDVYCLVLMLSKIAISIVNRIK